MVKTINMSLNEYEADMQNSRETGLCNALNQILMFLISKKSPSEFFGAGSFDPRFEKCKLMLSIFTHMGIDPVEIQKVTKVIPSANAEKVIEAEKTTEAENVPCETAKT